MNDRREDFIPYWLQTGMPALENVASPVASPGREVMYPWEYPWPHTSPRDMWAESTASNPSVPSPTLPFAAPPSNLDLSTSSWLNTVRPFGADLKQPAPHSAIALGTGHAAVGISVAAHIAAGQVGGIHAARSIRRAAVVVPLRAARISTPPSTGRLPLRWDDGSPATAVPQPSPVTAAGLAKQGSVALAKALIGVPGMVGDARELGFGIGDWISQKILDRRTLTDQQRLEQAHGADFTPGQSSHADRARQRQQRQDEARRNLFATNPFSALAPSSSDIQGVIEQVTGPFRKPENMPEEYVDTIGQFATSIFGGPGGWVRRGAQWLGPSLASETAGQLTKGTEWEPASRFAATILAAARLISFARRRRAEQPRRRWLSHRRRAQPSRVKCRSRRHSALRTRVNALLARPSARCRNSMTQAPAATRRKKRCPAKLPSTCQERAINPTRGDRTIPVADGSIP